MLCCIETEFVVACPFCLHALSKFRGSMTPNLATFSMKHQPCPQVEDIQEDLDEVRSVPAAEPPVWVNPTRER